MPEQTAPGQLSAISSREIAPLERLSLHRYRSWKRFHYGPRRRSGPLMKTLHQYPSAVLVAGCQRSGTTMLTRVIANSAGFRSLSLTHDDELDAALALSGDITLPAARYCLQTTYLNERFAEYRDLGPSHRLIWVLRNPYSVVYSMVHNWKRFALNELYASCGAGWASEQGIDRNRSWWSIGPSRLEKACLAYCAKTSQILVIREMLPPERLMIVEYDRLVQARSNWLRAIFDFVDEPYDETYAGAVRADSTNKADALDARERAQITEWCEPVYRRCLETVSTLSQADLGRSSSI